MLLAFDQASIWNISFYWVLIVILELVVRQGNFGLRRKSILLVEVWEALGVAVPLFWFVRQTNYEQLRPAEMILVLCMILFYVFIRPRIWFSTGGGKLTFLYKPELKHEKYS